MPLFGVHLYPTGYSMDPVDVIKAAEERGLDSASYPEHTHIPTSRKTPFPFGGDLPKHYAELHDPFIVMAAAASVTRRIILGTGVCLIPEHDPILLAKQAASLDVISRGRFFLGVGAGWNAEEMENHGSKINVRWPLTRERVLAIKKIWNSPEAEFHGKYVNFDPIWSWPKPVQTGGPPVLMGSASPRSIDRLMDFCDGWYAPDMIPDVAYYKTGIIRLREWASGTGRQLRDIHLSIQLGVVENGERAKRLLDAGFRHLLFSIMPAPADKTLKILDRYADLATSLRKESD
ncbi:MAG TPA: LLM class F420-dependent oxidoreductase [Candidatus Binataceae bacterium]|nr:LLM class F420-dependent oxidoreductase [Candidatus Binataceae bacterium]